MDQEQNDMSYVYKTTKRRPIINYLRPFKSLNNNKKSISDFSFMTFVTNV